MATIQLDFDEYEGVPILTIYKVTWPSSDEESYFTNELMAKSFAEDVSTGEPGTVTSITVLT